MEPFWHEIILQFEPPIGINPYRKPLLNYIDNLCKTKGYCVETNGTSSFIRDDFGQFAFAFKNIEDAILFKLMFG